MSDVIAVNRGLAEVSLPKPQCIPKMVLNNAAFCDIASSLVSIGIQTSEINNWEKGGRLCVNIWA